MGCEKPEILERGLIENDQSILSFGEYPWCYSAAAASIAGRLAELAERFRPDVIVVEETNLGRNRYTQKILEFIHQELLRLLRPLDIPVRYINTGEWRRVAGVSISALERKNNDRLNRARRLHRETGITLAAAKKKLGVKGKVTKKHVSVRFINELYDFDWKLKDNDTAEAICLGIAFFKGASFCDGDPNHKGK